LKKGFVSLDVCLFFKSGTMVLKKGFVSLDVCLFFFGKKGHALFYRE